MKLVPSRGIERDDAGTFDERPNGGGYTSPGNTGVCRCPRSLRVFEGCIEPDRETRNAHVGPIKNDPVVPLRVYKAGDVTTQFVRKPEPAAGPCESDCAQNSQKNQILSLEHAALFALEAEPAA